MPTIGEIVDQEMHDENERLKKSLATSEKALTDLVAAAEPIAAFREYGEPDEHEVWVIVGRDKTLKMTMGDIRKLHAESERARKVL